MKSVLSLLALAGVAVMSGCASSPSVPAGMQAGKFVSYECEGGKRLQARLAADGSTVEVQLVPDGSAALTKACDLPTE